MNTMLDDGTFEKFQGATSTVLGAGQLIIYYVIATALSNMYPSWTLVVYGVSGLFGLEALLMLGFGLFMLYIGVTS